MKKPHVLNRAMFNRGGTSAYGRGITSNLVSDEQRQRFNYGGRVGFAQKSYVRPEFAIAAEEELRGPMYTKPWITEQFRDKYYLDTEEADTGIPISGMQGMIETEGDFDIEGRPVLSPVESRTRKLLKENPEAYQDYYKDYAQTYEDRIAKQKEILTAGGKNTAMFQEDIAGPVVEEGYLKEAYKRGPEGGDANLPTDRASDVID